MSALGSENHDLGYPIVVAPSVRAALTDFLARQGGRFVVLCDANVVSYGHELTNGVRDRLAFIPARLGERRKRLSTVEDVLRALLRSGADRKTLVLGIGGGVSSDLFGFAASMYMRGVPYAHVATSLVAMVDAAIGGKTGVDLPEGKNLAGTFSNPVAVFAHIDALATLPYRNMREGLAEMVKHAVIEGGDLFAAILAPGDMPGGEPPGEGPEVTAGVQRQGCLIGMSHCSTASFFPCTGGTWCVRWRCGNAPWLWSN